MVQTATPTRAAGESRCGRLIREIWVHSQATHAEAERLVRVAP